MSTIGLRNACSIKIKLQRGRPLVYFLSGVRSKRSKWQKTEGVCFFAQLSRLSISSFQLFFRCCRCSDLAQLFLRSSCQLFVGVVSEFFFENMPKLRTSGMRQSSPGSCFLFPFLIEVSSMQIGGFSLKLCLIATWKVDLFFGCFLCLSQGTD